MMRYVVYDEQTGEIAAVCTASTEEMMQADARDGKAVMAYREEVSDRTHRVERAGPFLKQREVVRKDAGNAATSR